MDRLDPRLVELAGAVSDSRPVDWNLEAERARDELELEALTNLRRLDEIAAACRSLEDSRTAPKADPRPGTVPSRWGHLEILEKTGAGAAAEVFRARDTRLGHEVALKLFHATALSDAERALLLEEGRRHVKVKHPNVAAVYGADEHDGRVGLWLEYIDGATLAELSRNPKHGPFSAAEATTIGIELCRALAAVHRAGFAHGDVKAQNVMRERGGRIVLMDFSTSQPLEPAAEGGDVLAGTPLYMAPELMLEGAHPGPQTDIYSLGVLLFHMVTGEFPVHASTLSDLRDALGSRERRSLRELRPDLPQYYVDAVEFALAHDPSERGDSAGALEKILGSGRSVSDHLVKWERAVRSVAASGKLAVKLGGALLGILLFLTMLGFISSTALDVTLGRPGDFVSEGPFDWLVWGFRSFIPISVYMFVAAVPVVAGIYVLRLFFRVSPGSRAWLGARTSRLRRLAGKWGLGDPEVQSTVLFLAAAAAIGLVVWSFSDLLGAVASLLGEEVDAIHPLLRPENDGVYILYRRSLAVLILILAVSWFATFRGWRRQRPRRGWAPLAAAAIAIVGGVVLMELPYRLLMHNEYERVDLGGTRAYVIGQRGSDLLLFCPGASGPKNRIVNAEDERIRRLGRYESVFFE